MSVSSEDRDPLDPQDPSRGQDETLPVPRRGDVGRRDDPVAPEAVDGTDGDESLDAALGVAFRQDTSLGRSALERIERLHGVGSRVLLRDESQTTAPLSLRREGQERPKDDSRYQVIGEIARGGIGVVYRGLDTDLNRDVALKVLRAEYRDRRDVVQRFVEEAQVGGQLQHPGIVPIYGMGLQPDGRPSFAMKLIKGRTLAALLEIDGHGTDLVAVFEQVVQTVAYAHSRGVIHRDLKPANVMVGAFGEVQVVDWGFAKVLGSAEPERMPGRTLITTVRSGPEGSQSVVGSVMGTPAYMPPEQALGQIEDLDERADVFSLGAILCELLTGEPIYAGDPRDQLVAAAQARLDGAMARLAACDAPEGLKQIVRDCLEPPRAARPRDAGVVAQRLAGHFARVEERARAADVAAARARNEAMLSRAQRRRSLVLAGMVMLAVGTGGGGWLYLDAERAAREASVRPRIDAALSTAGELAARSQWDGALTAARQAIRLADVEGVDGARARGVLASLERDSAATLAATRAAAADAVLLVELEKLRSNHGELVGPGVGRPMLQANVQDAAATDAGYAAAFARRFGSLEAGVEHMAASPQKTRFAEHLAFWCRLRKRKPRDAEWQPLRDLALRIDPENGPLREALIDGDAATLRGLVADGAAGVPPVLAAEFALSLVEVGEHEVAIPWMRRQLLVHGDDVALHLAMAQACRRAGAARDALDHATAAVALRPRSVLAWTSLARGHDVAEEHEQALRAAERAAAIDPDDRDVALVIVAVMTALGREEELLRRTEDVLSRSPDDLAALSQRVAILHERRDYAAASAAQRRLHELLPDDRQVLGALALTLSTLGQADEAVRVVEANALRHPDDDFLAQLRETLLTDQRSRKEQEARLDAKIERLAAGEEVETSAPESADLAGRCDDVGRYDLAVALWQRAFGQLPSLADDPWQANRYDAARSAVLAGPATHGQALSWLTDELAALTREAGQRPADVVRSLLHWQRDPDLAVVRDGDQPPAEFQAFWKDVADRLAELQK